VYVERVKEIPGVRRDSATRTWRVKLSWAACVVARGVFGAELEVGPALNEWALDERHRRIEPALKLREEKA
jgi:hypothetical protein